MTPQEISEFDRRIDPSNYKIGQYHTIEKPNDSLLNGEWYPESNYEIDADKVKSFISSLLASREKEWKERVLQKIPRERIETNTDSDYGSQYVCYSEYILGWNEYRAAAITAIQNL